MIIRLPKRLYQDILADLDRAHAHAYERVGFLFLRRSRSDAEVILQGVAYEPVQDAHYAPSTDFGAVINADAIRAAMQTAMNESLSAFHVHKHPHHGRPWFSRTDLGSLTELVPAFFGVDLGPHGALVFSDDKAAALVWTARAARPVVADKIMTVGFPMKNLGR